MKYTDPREPHAHALRDYFAGARDATLTLYSDLGEQEEIPAALFFRTPEEFFPFERAALELCRGRVLDVGAGTGVHSLYLQERGHDVVAIDVMADAVEIMRERGVRDARYAGEAWIELEYKGVKGPPFRELYADSETLTELAEAAGWDVEIVLREGMGGYVARLTGAPPAG